MAPPGVSAGDPAVMSTSRCWIAPPPFLFGRALISARCPRAQLGRGEGAQHPAPPPPPSPGVVSPGWCWAERVKGGHSRAACPLLKREPFCSDPAWSGMCPRVTATGRSPRPIVAAHGGGRVGDTAGTVPLAPQQ